jgi:hypothetical protein
MTKEVWSLSVFLDHSLSVALKDSNAGTSFKMYDALTSVMLQSPKSLISDVCTGISRSDRAKCSQFS